MMIGFIGFLGKEIIDFYINLYYNIINNQEDVAYNRMQDVLHGRRSGTKGYKWRFATEEEIKQYGIFNIVKYINNTDNK